MNRNFKIELRVTEMEKAILEKKANDRNLSVSEYLRRAGFGQKVAYRLTPEELEVYKDFHKYHKNFASLSNLFKSGHPDFYKEAHILMVEMKEHLKKIQ